MTHEQAERLGRRALDAGFEPDRSKCGCCGQHGPCWRFVASHWPDFRDAATEGILAGQGRALWRNDWLSPVWMGQRWILPDGFGESLGKGPTRAHCWVDALEAAP